jgi:hypothetical protein
MKCRTCGAESNDSAYVTCHNPECPHRPKMLSLQADVARLTAAKAKFEGDTLRAARDGVMAASVALVRRATGMHPHRVGELPEFDKLRNAVGYLEHLAEPWECQSSLCVHPDYCARRNGCQFRVEGDSE